MKYTIAHILNQMHELFKDYPVTELNYSTPFQCLIAVMMSAQTTDVQVNKVTDTLFQQIQSPADVLTLWKKELGQRIKTVGLWTAKQKNIYTTAEILEKKSQSLREKRHINSEKDKTLRPVYRDSQEVLDQRNYYLPDTIESMMDLPGVWIKTAKVVLYVLYGQPRVAVDTHVHRVMNRLAVIDTKTPNQSSKQLEKLIPNELKGIAHRSIIYFGRYLCKAKKPECERCPLKSWCKRYAEQQR